MDLPRDVIQPRTVRSRNRLSGPRPAERSPLAPSLAPLAPFLATLARNSLSVTLVAPFPWLPRQSRERRAAGGLPVCHNLAAYWTNRNKSWIPTARRIVSIQASPRPIDPCRSCHPTPHAPRRTLGGRGGGACTGCRCGYIRGPTTRRRLHATTPIASGAGPTHAVAGVSNNELRARAEPIVSWCARSSRVRPPGQGRRRVWYKPATSAGEGPSHPNGAARGDLVARPSRGGLVRLARPPVPAADMGQAACSLADYYGAHSFTQRRERYARRQSFRKPSWIPKPRRVGAADSTPSHFISRIWVVKGVLVFLYWPLWSWAVIIDMLRISG